MTAHLFERRHSRPAVTTPTGPTMHQLGPSGYARRQDTQSASWFDLPDALPRPAPYQPCTSGISSHQLRVWSSCRSRDIFEGATPE